MGNLGIYQQMTTIAKKVGGPKNLIALTLATGYAGGKMLEVVCKKVAKTARKNKKKTISENKIYMIRKESISNEGLKFNVGDHIRVCEIDDDVVLIEKIGDQNNPYYISAELLYSMTR